MRWARKCDNVRTHWIVSRNVRIHYCEHRYRVHIWRYVISQRLFWMRWAQNLTHWAQRCAYGPHDYAMA